MGWFMTGFTTWLSFFSQRSTSTNVWDFLRLCQAPRREFGQAYMILMDWVEGAKIHPHLMFSLPGQLTPDPHIFKMEAGNWSPHDVNVTIQTHENTFNNIKYISYIIMCHIYIYYIILLKRQCGFRCLDFSKEEMTDLLVVNHFALPAWDFTRNHFGSGFLALGSHPWPSMARPWLTDGLLERNE